MAGALNWTGITDSYGVPVGSYYLSVVSTREAITEAGPDISLNPTSWFRWAGNALTEGIDPRQHRHRAAGPSLGVHRDDHPGAVAAALRDVLDVAVLAGHLVSAAVRGAAQPARRTVRVSHLPGAGARRRRLPPDRARPPRQRLGNHVEHLHDRHHRHHLDQRPAHRALQRQRPAQPRPQPRLHRRPGRDEQRRDRTGRHPGPTQPPHRRHRRCHNPNAVAAVELRRPGRRHRQLRQRILASPPHRSTRRARPRHGRRLRRRMRCPPSAFLRPAPRRQQRRHRVLVLGARRCA